MRPSHSLPLPRAQVACDWCIKRNRKAECIILSYVPFPSANFKLSLFNLLGAIILAVGWHEMTTGPRRWPFINTQIDQISSLGAEVGFFFPLRAHICLPSRRTSFVSLVLSMTSLFSFQTFVFFCLSETNRSPTHWVFSPRVLPCSCWPEAVEFSSTDGRGVWLSQPCKHKPSLISSLDLKHDSRSLQPLWSHLAHWFP